MDETKKTAALHANSPLKIEGTVNVRELGGYETEDGSMTRKHVFLRGDSLQNLTFEGEEELYNYGVRTIVDLRSGVERIAHRDNVSHREFHYEHADMLDHVQSEMAKGEIFGETADLPKTITGLYIMIIETEQKGIHKALSDLIQAEGTAIFHCTAGKDRTGIIAMFLLHMAGVPEEIILIDYAASAHHVAPAYQQQEVLLERVAEDVLPQGAFGAEPKYMAGLLDHLKQKYGTIENYLDGIGITQDKRDQLRAKFLEEKTAENAG